MDQTTLQPSERPLCEVYDTGLFDLDGVVYIGPEAVPGAPDRLRQLVNRGMRVVYVTNNASRLPRTVAGHLDELGAPVTEDTVVTSAQAAARLVSDLVPAGATVLVVGGEGLFAALTERGLRTVDAYDERVAALVQGFGPAVGWPQLAEGVRAVDAGRPWIATNPDVSMPTPTGRAPGNGALIEVIALVTGRRPIVAGKPMTPLFDEAVRRSGARRPLVVGDRLDTDIEGAVSAGRDSLLVFTGSTDLPTLAAAPRGSRPSFLAADLGGLLRAHPRPVPTRVGVWRCGGWLAEVTSEGEPVLRRAEDAPHVDAAPMDAPGAGTQPGDSGDPAEAEDAARALVAACWSRMDVAGGPVEAGPVASAWRAAGWSQWLSVGGVTVAPATSQ